MASLIPLDVTKLREILAKSNMKKLKLWKVLAPRLIMLNPDKLPMFLSMSTDNIKMFCRMCDVSWFESGDAFDVQNGAILLEGKI